MNLDNFDLHRFVVSMVALIICITIHEFAHAYSAWRAGDETPKLQGRISLNPIDHLHPIGTIMMVLSSLSGFGIGWGKPVMINHNNFRNPRWDNLRVSLWGPLSNLITAVILGLVLRFVGIKLPANAFELIFMIVLISISLALFNLIPIAPLDGSHILSALLPRDQAIQYDRFMGQYGFMVFMGLIFLAPNVLPAIITPPLTLMMRIIVGI